MEIKMLRLSKETIGTTSYSKRLSKEMTKEHLDPLENKEEFFGVQSISDRDKYSQEENFTPTHLSNTRRHSCCIFDLHMVCFLIYMWCVYSRDVLFLFTPGTIPLHLQLSSKSRIFNKMHYAYRRFIARLYRNRLRSEQPVAVYWVECMDSRSAFSPLEDIRKVLVIFSGTSFGL